MQLFSLRLIALSVSLGVATLAQAAPVALSQPAQPLADALQSFARASGLQVNYDPAALVGKRAPALAGRMEPDVALQRLLAGSGLAASVSGSVATVAPVATQAAAGSVALDTTTISADDGSLTGRTTTEGTRSYTTGAMSTSTGLPLSIRETPQSVSVITRQRMEDQGMTDLNDVVRYAPGVTLRKFGGDRQEFLSRGFRIDNVMYDGLPTTAGTFTLDSLSSADLSIYDRVEVVRGATGLMTGAGDPSATLNLVRKRPTAFPQVSVTTSAGSWDRYRTEVDASNKLNEAGTLRGRAVAAYEDGNSFQDVRERKRQTFYGVLEADLSDATTWTIGASKQREDKTSDWGSLPSGPNGENLHLSRSTFLSGDWAYWDQDNYTLFSDITHTFDNGWKAKLAAQQVWANSDTYSNYLTSTAADFSYSSVSDFGTASGAYRTDSDQLNIDASVSGPLQLMGREHELMAGISRRQDKFYQRGGYSGATPVDIYNFRPSSIPKPAKDTLTPYASKNTTTEEAIYAAARFNPIDPLHVIVGGRVSWYDFDNLYSDNDYKATREVTPYAGIIYDLNDTYSVYASYTEIFKPQSEQNSGGSVLEPMTGKSYEIGLKGAYFDGALNASVALFDTIQENRAYLPANQATFCPGYPAQSCYSAAGEVRSRGIDAEISGQLTPNWQASAAYTLVLSQYTKDVTYEDRRFAPEQPKHLFKAATSYQLTGSLSNWRIGGDLQAQSETFQRVGTGEAKQDSYALVGLMAGYRFNEHWDGRVNFNNIFNEKYWQGIPTGTGSGTYGDPRNVMLSLKWTL
ncbi:TonB-dependent siderophore receptor [Pseudomonas oryzihabitans]|uniref:Outer-membrane receptor for ferric coprogen and ferric-rhodotorulic acid n=1 Tax=Pseudomonas oryzihabitans TaxID=47885 RepID=A0A1G5P5Y4_9PSED|nr:TonB-dependent siderophore receptor [Pseudomonas psychrotolerans]NMY91372.1 TonB-dependent siderophore receptor [Pseudomonas psychrotolerans]SCZ44491.1 outer-membrane receptor for ferric coprogen and ferric-rhodotorulic acid [Pseudomonas psychrotolerans]